MVMQLENAQAPVFLTPHSSDHPHPSPLILNNCRSIRYRRRYVSGGPEGRSITICIWADKTSHLSTSLQKQWVMLRIDEKQKREMDLLEKMRKDDRNHELRLVQSLGQMTLAQPPPTPSLYYPPPPVSEMPQTLPIQPVAGTIGMGYPQMHTQAHTTQSITKTHHSY